MTRAAIATAKARAKAATRSPLVIGARKNYAGFAGAGYPVWSEAIDHLGNTPRTRAGFSSLTDAHFYRDAREDVLALGGGFRRGTGTISEAESRNAALER
jgi:hypothetical protein